MSSKIRTALHNCEQHESRIQSLVQKVTNAKVIVPLAITAGFAATTAIVGPAITDGVSSFSSLVMDSIDSIQALKNSSPKIFYGLVGSLIAGGAVLAAVGYLEHRDEKKTLNASGLDASAVNAAWEVIVKTNDTVTKRVAHHQAWTADIFDRPTKSSSEILKKYGFNPNNRPAMLDLQRAYIHGVKNAFVIAQEDNRQAKIGGSTHDQYTNKNIMRGMLSYYKDLGYSLTPGPNNTVLACDLVTTGLAAIRELALRDMVTPGKVTSKENKADNGLTR
jgi:hypothetical protein